MSNFTFFYNVFYGICLLKSFKSHLSVIVCAASLKLRRSENAVLGNGLKELQESMDRCTGRRDISIIVFDAEREG